MRLLLCSLGLGAVPDFLDRRSGRLGFVPTAGNVVDDPDFVRRDRARLVEFGYDVVDLDFDTPDSGVAEALHSVDALFVAGGNTFHLLNSIRRSGLEGLLVDLVRGGMPYIGASAGAVVAGPTVEPVVTLDDPGVAPDLGSHRALGLTDIVVLPHYGKERYRHLYDAVQATYRDTCRLLPLRDDQAVLVHGGAAPVMIDLR